MQRSHARTLATLTDIVAAARALLEERGDHTFTVQELAERAGVAVQTFYRHFPSKDELLLAVFEELVHEGTDNFRAAAAGTKDPLQRLRTVIEGSILPEQNTGIGFNAALLVREHLRLAEIFPKEVELAQRPYVALVSEIIEDAVDQGAIPARSDVGQDAQLIMYLVRSVYQVVVTTAAEGHEALAEHTWHFCLGGLLFQAPPRPVVMANGRSRPKS
jgi:TetR/AcrR family transcriptional regulator